MSKDLFSFAMMQLFTALSPRSGGYPPDRRSAPSGKGLLVPTTSIMLIQFLFLLVHVVDDPKEPCFFTVNFRQIPSCSFLPLMIGSWTR